MIIIPGQNYNNIIQGTWAYHPTDLHVLGGWFGNHDSNPANGDSVSYKVYLTKGNYTILFYTSKNGAYGINKLYLDTTEIASFDCYSSITLRNQRLLGTCNVQKSDLYDLILKVDGKNPLATGYNSAFNYISLWRTS
jgi:hypothetical protein